MAISVSSKTTSSITAFCSYPSGTTITRTKMYRNGSYIGDGSASNNFSYTFGGLTPGTSYNISVQWFTGTGGTTELGTNSTSATTDQAVPPSTPTGFSGNPISGSQISVSWNASNGASGYHLYRNGSYITSTTGTNYTFSGLSEYTTYTLSVSAHNSYGESATTGGSYTTRDATAPIMGYVSTNPGIYHIDTDAFGDDYQSGVSGYWFYLDGVLKGTVYGANTRSYRYTGLNPETQYVVSVKCFDAYGNSSESLEKTVTTLPNRPPNFSWLYSNISSGSNAVVDHRDWNNLAVKINEFRVFKGLSTYGFTTVSSSTGDITATLFNQLVNAANGLSAHMSNDVMPSTKSYGSDFFASYLNNIVTSIHSVN